MKSPVNHAAFRCATVILSALLVIASLSMTGCSLLSLIPNRDPAPDDTTILQPEDTDPSNSPETPPEDEPPEEDKPVLPSYYNPMTGLAAETDLSLARPVAICIGNTSGAFSQYGLRSAEIVIEAPIEEGATKLVILTNSYAASPQLGAVGPTRAYLQSFAAAFGAVSVSAGISDKDPGKFSNEFSAIDYARDGLTTVFYRTDELPNALFTSGTRLIGALENFEKCGATMPCQFLPYGTFATAGEEKASGVVIPYSDSHVTQFAYDNARQSYVCVQNGAMKQTAEDDALSFTNLLLLTCESALLNKVTGTEFELNTTSGGSGYYASLGGYTEIIWSRNEEGSLVITDKNGAPISFNRGNTYIGLIDLAESSSVLIVR